MLLIKVGTSLSGRSLLKTRVSASAGYRLASTQDNKAQKEGFVAKFLGPDAATVKPGAKPNRWAFFAPAFATYVNSVFKFLNSYILLRSPSFQPCVSGCSIRMVRNLSGPVQRIWLCFLRCSGLDVGFLHLPHVYNGN